MRASFPLLLLAGAGLGGCGDHRPDAGPGANAPPMAGRLAHDGIREASGLVRSLRDESLLWVVNDGGASPTLFAVGTDGSHRGAIDVGSAANIDWEDLAAFTIDGEPWIAIADIGDNGAARESVVLYVLREPEFPLAAVVEPSWQLRFSYPDGPRDAEAISVDAGESTVYVLTKRTVPAELYALPLVPEGGASEIRTTARYLGAIASLPQPSGDDLRQAVARNSWHWQPTAMDFSADGSLAAIMTYRAVYLYRRSGSEAWFDTLQAVPEEIPLGGARAAEALGIADDALFVTVEAENAPLYRIDLSRRPIADR